MRTLAALVCLFLLLGSASGQNAGRGIEVSDIDRGADPCTDFYAFANGSWRARNPIPASMPRWSRRWAAGESTKERLRELLEETSAAGGAPKGSVEQVIGDFYGACMDEKEIDRLGVEPLAPLRSEIARLRNAADVQQMIARFHRLAIRVPFSVTGESDAHDPNQVIAKINASGLGMPDRDYYVKTDTRFQDARAKYLAHIAAMFLLAGANAPRAKAAADTIMRMETKLAVASLDDVALTVPKATE